MKLKDITYKQMYFYCKNKVCPNCQLNIEHECMLIYLRLKKIFEKHKNDEIEL